MDFKTLMRNYSRYFLVVFNLFFVLTGVVIISVGASVKAYYNEYHTFLDNKYIYASDLLIIIGVVIFIISFFGCCGALKENACMTTTFSTLLIVIFILEVFVGIGGFLLKGRTETLLDNTMKQTMSHYKNPQFNETTKLWDTIQENFQCCGVDNASDWYNVTGKNNLPISCCEIPPGSIGPFTCIESSAYTEGCLQEFGDYIRGHATTIESVGLSFAVLQLLGILFSCYLAKQIRSDYETV